MCKNKETVLRERKGVVMRESNGKERIGIKRKKLDGSGPGAFAAGL